MSVFENNIKFQVNYKSHIDCLVVINLALVCKESNKQGYQNYNWMKKEILILFYGHGVSFHPYLSTFILYGSIPVWGGHSSAT